MAVLRYSQPAIEDLERLVAFLSESDPAAAESTGALIVEGLEVLERHPLIGRAVGSSRRELVISRGRTGYIALYQYEPQLDHAIILGIRHQREAGFQE